MKKLALITKKVDFELLTFGETATNGFSKKTTTICFLGIAIYKETINHN
jgi:uncharacterized protein YprB with RNaseH-like and TPR domain